MMIYMMMMMVVEEEGKSIHFENNTLDLPSLQKVKIGNSSFMLCKQITFSSMLLYKSFNLVPPNAIDLPKVESISLDMYAFQGDASCLHQLNANQHMNKTSNKCTSQLVMSSM